MRAIVLHGHREDRRIFHPLSQLLARFGQLLVIDGERVFFRGQGREPFLLVESDRLQNLCLPGALLILKERPAACAPPPALPYAAAVFLSSDGPSVALAKMGGCPAIACGMGGADTLTLSSYESDSAVASLLRPIPTAEGGVVEPYDLPFFYDTQPSRYTVMAIAAAMSFFNWVEEGNGEIRL